MGMSHLMRDVEMPLSGVLYRMEDIGFTVDTAFLRQLGERYTQEIEQSKQQVFAACGTTFNLNSTQQLGDVLFDKLQLRTARKPRAAIPPPPKCWKVCRTSRRRSLRRYYAIGS